MAIERALISVYDKTGIVEFARELASLGIEIVSTGGTAQTAARVGNPRARRVRSDRLARNARRAREDAASESARRNSLPARQAEDRKQAAEHSIVPIDLVVVNLYPFRRPRPSPASRPEELIENIDIGGPAMVRSAAKNFQSVGVVTDPADYAAIAAELREKQRAESRNAPRARAQGLCPNRALRRRNRDRARAAARQRRGSLSARSKNCPSESTSRSNAASRCVTAKIRTRPPRFTFPRGARSRVLPARSSFRARSFPTIISSISTRRGRWSQEFKRPAVAIIKHNNPCGAAEQDSLREAYLKALACDPVSAFGGVLAFNRALDAATAEEVAKLFVECIVAPGYEPDALAAFASKKNLRLLELEMSAASAPRARRTRAEAHFRRRAGAGSRSPRAHGSRSEGRHRARADGSRNARRCSSPGRSRST